MLGPLRGVVFRWCPGLQLRDGVVLAGELVDEKVKGAMQVGEIIWVKKAGVNVSFRSEN